VLAQYLGWPSIFVFLAIFSGALLGAILLFFPETSRRIVGNGSRPPQTWNVPAWQLLFSSLCSDKKRVQLERPETLKLQKSGLSNPFKSITLLFDKQTGLILFYTGLAYAAFSFVISGMQSLLATVYGLTTFQVGLCYLPLGIGALISSVVLSRLVDWNYRRIATKYSYPITRNRQQPLGAFPIEKARLQIALPMVRTFPMLIRTF